MWRGTFVVVVELAGFVVGGESGGGEQFVVDARQRFCSFVFLGGLDELFSNLHVLLLFALLLVQLVRTRPRSTVLNPPPSTDSIFLGAEGKRLIPEPKIGG